MKMLVAVTTLSISATVAGAAPNSQSGSQWFDCSARVLQSEELPFAPVGQWLVNVTLEITPPNGPAYATTFHDWMPWQGPPPRRGQVFRLLCNPANPTDLRIAWRPPRRSNH